MHPNISGFLITAGFFFFVILVGSACSRLDDSNDTPNHWDALTQADSYYEHCTNVLEARGYKSLASLVTHPDGGWTLSYIFEENELFVRQRITVVYDVSGREFIVTKESPDDDTWCYELGESLDDLRPEDIYSLLSPTDSETVFLNRYDMPGDFRLFAHQNGYILADIGAAIFVDQTTQVVISGIDFDYRPFEVDDPDLNILELLGLPDNE